MSFGLQSNYLGYLENYQELRDTAQQAMQAMLEQMRYAQNTQRNYLCTTASSASTAAVQLIPHLEARFVPETAKPESNIEWLDRRVEEMRVRL